MIAVSSKRMTTSFMRLRKFIPRCRRFSLYAPYSQVENQKEKNRYVLAMFPYPSGHLHLGHMRVYSISDALARYYRLNGKHVLHPIGWDAFGLPAENAARLHGVPAAEWTATNIDVMRQQLLHTGVQFDWNAELRTCDPVYYRWTQWIFLKLYEKGLVHRRLSTVHWDPVDETVLAAEQIDASGRSWRSGALVEQRKLRQWAVETPRYAKRLLDGLHQLRRSWREVADIQCNWIGECDVYRFLLPVKSQDGTEEELLDLRLADPIELERAEFVLLQSNHSLVEGQYNKHARLSKTVENIITGRQMPILVLDSDETNDQFANEFHLKARLGFREKCERDKKLANDFKIEHIQHKQLNHNLELILNKFKSRNMGGYLTSRKLEDWVVSRQRRWGTPIPMLLKGNQHFPYPEDKLPLLSLHQGQNFNDYKIVEETLDTFFDSSWYYMRFLDPQNAEKLCDPLKIQNFYPVDVYVGGIEHADVHLFFARFIAHFLHDIGYLNTPEPFRRLLPQGIVRGQTFKEIDSGRYVFATEVEQDKHQVYRSKKNGKELEMVYEKMSKSKANGVDPLVVIDKVGIDLTRLQLLGTAAPRAHLNWSETNLKGYQKWIDRMQWVVDAYVNGRQAETIKDKLELVSSKREEFFRENYNYFVQNVSTCLEILHLHNTAIARLQGFTNALRKIDPNEAGRSIELERCVHAMVVMLQVFAPETAKTFWSRLCYAEPLQANVRVKNTALADQCWPQVDQDADIDFGVQMLDISCSRHKVQRNYIEQLDNQQVIQLACQKHHNAFFAELLREGINYEKVIVDRRPGLQVVLDLVVPTTVTEERLRRILDSLIKQKVEERKMAKSRRLKASCER